MDRIIYLLCTAILILLLATFSYSPPQRLTLNNYCHPELSLCVFCPLFQPISINQTFNVQAYVYSIEKIAFLTSKPGSHFKKDLCKEYLDAVTPTLTLNTHQQFGKYYAKGQIDFKSDNRISFLRRYIPKILQNFGDFIIVSRNVGDIEPLAYLEVSYNIENLLKYARIMGWSVLWALLFIFIDQKVGFELFSKNKKSSLILQITAIGASLLFSNNSDFFEFFGIVEAMYLSVIHLNLKESKNNNKSYVILWMIGCIFWRNLVIAGYFYVSIQQISEWMMTNARQHKLIGVLVAIGFFLKCIQAIISVGLIVFLSNLWSIVIFPICMLILEASYHRKMDAIKQDYSKK